MIEKEMVGDKGNFNTMDCYTIKIIVVGLLDRPRDSFMFISLCFFV